MTKGKKGAAKPPRPHSGGSYIRDPKTGALSPNVEPAPALAQSPASETPQAAPEGQEN